MTGHPGDILVSSFGGSSTPTTTFTREGPYAIPRPPWAPSVSRRLDGTIHNRILYQWHRLATTTS